MKNIFLFLSLLLCSTLSHSQNGLVQGPFKIDSDKSIYIKSESDVNYPLSLYFESNGVSQKVDSYEVDGDNPHVETVFFEKIDGVKNVIVLMSWHQLHSAEKISGNSYRVYGYKYIGDGLVINSRIKNDQNLNGMDGDFGSTFLKFKYKDAASIKQYIRGGY